MDKKFEFTDEEQNIIEKVVCENKICIAHDDNITKDDMLIEIGKRISELENNNGKILYFLPNLKKIHRYNRRYHDEKEKYNMVFENATYLNNNIRNFKRNEYDDISTIIIDGVNNTVSPTQCSMSVLSIYDFYIKAKKLNPKIRIYITYNCFMADTIVDLYAVSLILNRNWMKINSLYEAAEWGKFFWNTKENDTEEMRRNKYQIFQNVKILTSMVNKFVIYDEFELLKKMNFDMEINAIMEDNFCDELDTIMQNVKKNINNGLQVIKLDGEQTVSISGKYTKNYDFELLNDELNHRIENIGLGNDEVKIYLEKERSIYHIVNKHNKKSNNRQNNLISDDTKLVIYNSKEVEEKLFYDEKIEFANMYYLGDDIMKKFTNFLDLIKMLCKNNSILDKKLYLYVKKGNYKKNIDELRQKYHFINNIIVKNSEVLIGILEKYIDVVDAVSDIDFRENYKNFMKNNFV